MREVEPNFDDQSKAYDLLCIQFYLRIVKKNQKFHDITLLLPSEPFRRFIPVNIFHEVRSTPVFKRKIESIKSKLTDQPTGPNKSSTTYKRKRANSHL